jgi:hypothetical protein
MNSISFPPVIGANLVELKGERLKTARCWDSVTKSYSKPCGMPRRHLGSEFHEGIEAPGRKFRGGIRNKERQI